MRKLQTTLRMRTAKKAGPRAGLLYQAASKSAAIRRKDQPALAAPFHPLPFPFVPRWKIHVALNFDGQVRQDHFVGKRQGQSNNRQTNK